MLSSAMHLGEKTLVELGYGAHEAHRATKVFADHDRSLFNKLYQADALEKRISIAREARDELAKVLAGDEEEKKQKQDRRPGIIQTTDAEVKMFIGSTV